MEKKKKLLVFVMQKKRIMIFNGDINILIFVYNILKWRLKLKNKLNISNLVNIKFVLDDKNKIGKQEKE